jgi:DNA-binding NtrC family response regulator
MTTNPQLIGVSPAVRQLRRDLEEAARTDAKVLISGESGVGKEVAARLLHRLSLRARAPLHVINCAGVPDTLLESELFGHVRGSFTDAYRDKRGWLDTADGGTVFMDEVGEMSLRMQALLLRFLETGEIQPVGSERHRPAVNVRVISATNRNLLDRVAAQEFREDLYYRLNVIHLVIPPLRERAEDVPLLVNHFIDTLSRGHKLEAPQLADEGMEALVRYSWPGNVRQLKNVIERLVIRSAGRTARAVDLQFGRSSNRPAAGAAVRAEVRDKPQAPSRAERLYEQLTKGGESFWSTVYGPFMARDLVREDLRLLIRMGLQETRGNYKAVVRLFNMPADDYKRFLRFLSKYQCHMPFQEFRMMAASAQPRSARSFESDAAIHAAL